MSQYFVPVYSSAFVSFKIEALVSEETGKWFIFLGRSTFSKWKSPLGSAVCAAVWHVC